MPPFPPYWVVIGAGSLVVGLLVTYASRSQALGLAAYFALTVLTYRETD